MKAETLFWGLKGVSHKQLEGRALAQMDGGKPVGLLGDWAGRETRLGQLGNVRQSLKRAA